MPADSKSSMGPPEGQVATSASRRTEIMAQPGDVTWIRIDLNPGDMLREAGAKLLRPE
jgi:hypothetical protein